jgi:hypothetical protein
MAETIFDALGDKGKLKIAKSPKTGKKDRKQGETSKTDKTACKDRPGHASHVFSICFTDIFKTTCRISGIVSFRLRRFRQVSFDFSVPRKPIVRGAGATSWTRLRTPPTPFPSF